MIKGIKHKTKSKRTYYMTRKKGGGVKRVYTDTKTFRKRKAYLKKKGRI